MKTSIGRHAAFAFALVSAFAMRTHAADITVTRFDDPAPVGCTAENCSLREAVIFANAFIGPDRILLPGGTYTLSIIGANEEAAQSGDLDITDDLFILGDGAGSTTIRWSLGFDRIFEIFDVPFSAPERQVTISGVTLQGGGAPSGSASTNKDGGGLSARGYNLFVKLVDVTFLDNTAMAGVGGGAYLYLRHLFVGASHFTHNSALRAGGAFIDGRGPSLSLVSNTATMNSAGRCGGLEVLVASNEHVALDFRNLIVSENTADHEGGGLCFGGFNESRLSNASIVNNVAGTSGPEGGGGGGLLLEYATPDASTAASTLVLDSSFVLGNTAHGPGGGILFGDDVSNTPGLPCELTLVGTQVATNETMAGAGHGGGGVYAMPAGTHCKTVIAAGSSIDHNSAQGFGGGVFFRGDADDTLDIVDSAIASNTSTSLGGGLYVQIGKTTISASTVNANSAPSYGGGIEVYGPLAVHSSTFDANVSPHGANIDNNGKTIVIDSSTIVAPASGSSTGSVYETNMGQPAFPTITNSILVGTCANDTPVASAHDIESPGSTCHLTGTSLANVTGTQLALGPFADNGGLTLTHKLLACSVAIAKVPAATCVPLDQRNYVRSAPCDIGAVESDGLHDILFQDGFDLY